MNKQWSADHLGKQTSSGLKPRSTRMGTQFVATLANIAQLCFHFLSMRLFVCLSILFCGGKCKKNQEISLRKNESIQALRTVNKPILSFRKSLKFSNGILTQLEKSLRKIHKISNIYFCLKESLSFKK